MGELLDASGLLRPLDENEVSLLTTIHEPFLANGKFPIFDFVDRELFKKGMDAATLLDGLPTTGGRALYGLIRPAGGRYRGAEDTVSLTIAGLVQCPRAGDAVAVFLSVLHLLIDKEQRTRSDPYEVPRVEVPGDQVNQHLQEAGFDLFAWTIPQLRTLLQYEPPDAVSGISGTPDEWTVTVSKDLRRYRSVTDKESYLDRVLEHLAPSSQPAERLYVSPFTLPNAMDFLDAVWQVRFKRERLFRLGSAGAVAALAFGCATEDEFKSRVSAFADALARMAVPEPPGAPPGAKSLVRLELFLKTSLASADVDRLHESIATLKAIVGIRAGTQHAGARKALVEGYALLGIPYPISGWATAWEIVQSRAVDALEAIREEVQRGS